MSYKGTSKGGKYTDYSGSNKQVKDDLERRLKVKRKAKNYKDTSKVSTAGKVADKIVGLDQKYGVGALVGKMRSAMSGKAKEQPKDKESVKTWKKKQNKDFLRFKGSMKSKTKLLPTATINKWEKAWLKNNPRPKD